MIHLLTFDFRRTPLALRERVAVGEHLLPRALHALREAGAREAAILSTCNRVEVLATLPPDGEGAALLMGYVAAWHGVRQSEIEEHGRVLVGEAAAAHLLRVACGLESLVPGEMQILGQVKQAARAAREAGTLGATLERLFASASAAGRRARQETGIARRPVSVSHAAVARIQQEFGGDLGGIRVLLIGSGKMGELAAQQLHQAGAAHVTVANRTLERACEMAQRWAGTPLGLEDLPTALAEADAVIAATGAPHLILHAEQIQAALAQRAGRGLLLLDLAVPRDIDPAVRDLPGVTLCDVDGLQEVVAANIESRNGEREQVEAIVAEALQAWRAEEAARAVAPTIVSLRRSAEQIRQAELDKALARLGHLSEQERAVIEAFSRGLMNKLLHTPTIRLREKATTDDGAQFCQTVEELFALPEAFHE